VKMNRPTALHCEASSRIDGGIPITPTAPPSSVVSTKEMTWRQRRNLSLRVGPSAQGDDIQIDRTDRRNAVMIIT